MSLGNMFEVGRRDGRLVASYLLGNEPEDDPRSYIDETDRLATHIWAKNIAKVLRERHL
ncbi:hypothetical protein LCGC14_0397530 [marine sediment metagenome]|uniref:Uncharacterized protein n=1 Tax=marine sediment metagenome TaxID=412755 RepID=A0A0F9T3S7_9ZZZZ